MGSVVRLFRACCNKTLASLFEILNFHPRRARTHCAPGFSLIQRMLTQKNGGDEGRLEKKIISPTSSVAECQTLGISLGGLVDTVQGLVFEVPRTRVTVTTQRMPPAR